jgi:NAD(P)-dependent dehydrogenase (short-subunit alcohol dehydrogenase family)
MKTSRRAVVTGASSGIGRAITEELLCMGWSVHCLCRSGPDIAHPAISFTPVDLLDAEAFEAALRDIGVVHALVHSVGVLKVGRHDAMSLDDGETMWRLHVDCAARMVKDLAPTMPDGGRIVLIGSRVAAGAAGRSLYAASKAALIGFARSVAAELAPRRITVNVVSPGATDTPMLRDPSRAGEPPKMPPFGRFVSPEEVAALTGFLLSDGAASLTGQNIVVCGGASL